MRLYQDFQLIPKPLHVALSYGNFAFKLFGIDDSFHRNVFVKTQVTIISLRKSVKQFRVRSGKLFKIIQLIQAWNWISIVQTVYLKYMGF